MKSLPVLSPSGRTAPKPFVLGVIVVYGLIFASQVLLSRPVMLRSGVAPFAVVQAALTFAWYVLHARRLRDAGLGTGAPLGIAILYGLGVVLFMLLAQFVSGVGAGEGSGDASGGFAGLLLFFFLMALFSGDANTLGLFFYMALVLLVVIFMPLLIALGFSVWAGTRRSSPAAAVATCAS